MDAERLEHLLRALPPAPAQWVADARDLIHTMAGEENEPPGHEVHGTHHDHLDDLPGVNADPDAPDLHELPDSHDQGHGGYDDHDGDAW